MVTSFGIFQNSPHNSRRTILF